MKKFSSTLALVANFALTKRTQLFRWSMMALMVGMLCSSCATLDKDAPKDPGSNPFFAIRQNVPTNEKNAPYFYKFKMIEVFKGDKSWPQQVLTMRDSIFSGWFTSASNEELTKKQLKKACSDCIDNNLRFKKWQSVTNRYTGNTTIKTYFYQEGSDKVFYKAKVVFVNGWPTRVE